MIMIKQLYKNPTVWTPERLEQLANCALVSKSWHHCAVLMRKIYKHNVNAKLCEIIGSKFNVPHPHITPGGSRY